MAVEQNSSQSACVCHCLQLSAWHEVRSEKKILHFAQATINHISYLSNA